MEMEKYGADRKALQEEELRKIKERLEGTELLSKEASPVREALEARKKDLEQSLSELDKQ
jgi:hypothetical protein